MTDGKGEKRRYISGLPLGCFSILPELGCAEINTAAYSKGLDDNNDNKPHSPNFLLKLSSPFVCSVPHSFLPISL